MTSQSMKSGHVVGEALGHARTIAIPTLPGLLLFAAAMAGQSYVNQLASEGGEAFFYWLFMGMVAIFTGCFWSATMYRRLLPEAGTRTVLADAIRLFLANLAVYGLFFIVIFLLTLFFSIFAGVLIDASGYDPSQNGQSPEEVWASIEALNQSGAASVLYILLVIATAGLVWLGLRLFLFGAATVAERNLTIFRSWPWTARHVARIALLWVSLQLVPWLVLGVVASWILHLGGMQTIFSFYAGAPAAPAGTGPLGLSALVAAATLILAPFYWLGHGLAAALYNRLAPNKVDAETTFG